MSLETIPTSVHCSDLGVFKNYLTNLYHMKYDFLCLRDYQTALPAIFVRAGAGLDAWWPNWDAKPANLSHPGTICGAAGR